MTFGLIVQSIALIQGAGWVQALDILFLTFVVIAAIWPYWSTRHISLSSYVVASYVQVGQRTTLEVWSDKPCRMKVRAAASVPHILKWDARSENFRAQLDWIPTLRGKYRTIRLEVFQAGPFGLLAWESLWEVPLLDTVWVAPALGSPQAFIEEDVGGEVRVRDERDEYNIREYVFGDLLNDVHWPASAHAGQMMVKEYPPGGRIVHMNVVLDTDPIEAEIKASNAMAWGHQILQQADSLWLTTHQEDGRRHSALVRQSEELGLQLAKAI